MSDPKSLGHCPGEMPPDPIHPGHISAGHPDAAEVVRAAVNESRRATEYRPLSDVLSDACHLSETLSILLDAWDMGPTVFSEYRRLDSLIHEALGQAKAEEAARADAYRRAKRAGAVFGE